ncbi:MAG: carboxypeptidase-like regulatory domain-containing protein, partial [Bacteroidales bacterium]|nr:carboxypeptidase-like regulatory domain-containing protein [Bacteroidales bacterium]
MTRKAILILFLLLAAWANFAQQQKVSGTITDHATEELLIGVNIIYGPGKGTVTDINGNYLLQLAAGEYDLEISYVGYEKQTRHIVVADKSLYIDFSLKNI